MSRRLPGFSLAFALLVVAGNAPAADLKGLRLVEDGQGTRAQLKVDALAGYKVFTLANPDRLVIDLAGTKLASGLRLPGPNGLVAGVRTGEPEPGTLRLVFDLGGAVQSENRVEREGQLSRLTVLLARPGQPFAAMPAPTSAPVMAAPTPPPPPLPE